jgi:hypothetical protein
MALTEKQRKSLDKHSDRVVAKQGRGDKPLSLFIRVAESRIYEGKPIHKALLKEVIFLRMTDLHEQDLRIPKNTPWSSDYLKYEGWTYASQKYLANRIGSTAHTHVNRVLKQIEEDGLLKSRSYKISGRGAQRRKQYFALEQSIEQRISELGVIEDEESNDNSDGIPVASHATADGVTRNRPVMPDATDRLRLTPFPVAPDAKKDVLEFASEVDDRERLRVPRPTGEVVDPSLRSEELKPTPKATPTPTPTAKAIGVGVGGSLPESNPTKSLATYLEDEPEMATGRNPLPSSANAAPTLCLRCGEANGKHVNQPGMVCPTLKAKAAAAPRAFDVEEA